MTDEAEWQEVPARPARRQIDVALRDDEARSIIIEAIDEAARLERVVDEEEAPRSAREILKAFQDGVLRRTPEDVEFPDIESAEPGKRRHFIRERRHRAVVREYAREVGLDLKRPITPIPPPSDEIKVVEQTAVIPDIVYSRIIQDVKSGYHHYEVLEPELSPIEAEALEFLRDTAIRMLEPRPGATRAELEKYLREWTEETIVDYSVLVDDVARERIMHHLVRDFLGYGKIDPIMRDPMIEDISCDGPGIPIYVFHREYQSMRTNVEFSGDKDLDAYIIRLAQVSGKSISTADPILDATLPDGSRLQATLAREVTTRGSSFTIRKVLGDPLTPPDLVRRGTISAEMAGLLWMGFETGKSMILAGGTASGKTTTLNALALFIPLQKKIVSIEDTREISLLHENWIAAVTRKSFSGELSKDINMYRLLEAALRQRPEYLIVGEVRGPEAMTLFQAMATGHATYSTMHADSFKAALNRLENPPLSVPRVMLQNLDCLAVQTQVQSGGRMARRLRELVEVAGFDAGTGTIVTNSAFRWNSRTDKHVYQGRSVTLEKYAQLRNMTQEEVDAEWAQRTKVIEWMVAKDIRHAKEVWKVINAYHSDRPSLLNKVYAETA